jgi:hypothetical protein
MRRAGTWRTGSPWSARSAGPYLEVVGLANEAQLASWQSFPAGAQRSLQAVELAAVRRARPRHRLAPSGRPGRGPPWQEHSSAY